MVMKSRLEVLQELVSKDANDSFSRYGLAMEYFKMDAKEKAVGVFIELIGRDPDYVPAYYQLGMAYESVEKPREAITAYEQGMSAAKKKGDLHTLGELQEAMDAVKDGLN